MTDMTSNPPQRIHHGRRRSLEFKVYFATIFVVALPFATVSYLRDVGVLRTLNLRGPLARAWSEADRTTPFLFSA